MLRKKPKDIELQVTIFQKHKLDRLDQIYKINLAPRRVLVYKSDQAIEYFTDARQFYRHDKPTKPSHV